MFSSAVFTGRDHGSRSTDCLIRAGCETYAEQATRPQQVVQLQQDVALLLLLLCPAAALIGSSRQFAVVNVGDWVAAQQGFRSSDAEGYGGTDGSRATWKGGRHGPFGRFGRLGQADRRCDDQKPRFLGGKVLVVAFIAVDGASC